MQTDTTEMLSASEAAARTGLSSETLRYYEREQLIPAVGRSAGNHRRYGAADLQRLSFLINLRATGMPLAAMREFAQLRLAGESGRPIGFSSSSTTEKSCASGSPRWA